MRMICKTRHLLTAAALFLAAALLSAPLSAAVKSYRIKVVKEYPHDSESYTQGLFFKDGQLYESTGQYGSSTFRKVDLETGKPLRRLDFSDKYFVEGSATLGDNLYILTWTNNVAFVYDMKSLSYKATRSYPRPGWGITSDGRQLIASDGSAVLYFMNPDLQMDDPVLDNLESRVRDIHYIDPSSIIIDKVIFGDSGDNIMPVVSCEKGSRRYKIQKKEWQKISKELEIKDIDDFENKELDIVDRIVDLGRYGNDPQEIRECLEYNMQMVWLCEDILPRDLIMSMSECQYKQAPVRDLRLNSELLLDPDNEVVNISEDMVASEEDIESLEVGDLPF